jgi:hypothetical protein
MNKFSSQRMHSNCRKLFASIIGGALAMASVIAAADTPAILPFIWTDVTGGLDMPWVGKGGRAHWYKKDVSGILEGYMDPKGPKIASRWGANSRSDEDPYDSAIKAVGYLRQIGYLKQWPSYPAQPGVESVSTFPYRLTIVSIQPTVVILRFDLSAALEDPIPFSAGTFPPSQRGNYYEQSLTWAGLKNKVMFGTKVLNRGTLLWFSPDAKVAPTLLDTASGRDLEIAIPGIRLRLVKMGQEWDVRM